MLHIYIMWKVLKSQGFTTFLHLKKKQHNALAQRIINCKNFFREVQTETPSYQSYINDLECGLICTTANSQPIWPQVGLIVHLKQPWLCASPDGLFKYGNQTTLLEIKCPYYRKDDVLIDHTKEASFIKCVQRWTPGSEQAPSVLHTNANYNVCNKHNTVFFFLFVYSSKQTVTIVVERDEHFLSEAIPRLEHF